MSQRSDDLLHEEQRSQTAIIGEDPWLEEFARAPYDPLIAARATGRLTGLAAKRAYRHWWMRVAVFLLGFVLVAGSLGGAISSIFGYTLPPSPGTFVIAIPFALVGARLIWSAVRRS